MMLAIRARGPNGASRHFAHMELGAFWDFAHVAWNVLQWTEDCYDNVLRSAFRSLEEIPLPNLT